MAGAGDTLRSLWTRIKRTATDTADELFLDAYRDQVEQARTLAAGGEPKAAAEMLEALLRERPEHAAALTLYGAVLLVLGRAEPAAEAFERALAVRRDDPQALVGHGQALLALGRLELAIAQLSRGVDTAGGDRELLADAYLALGQAWRGEGDLDKAVRDLRKAVAEAPDDPVARALLGDVLLDAGVSPGEARGHLERAAAAEPPPPSALLALGRLALAEGRAVEAAARFERAAGAVDVDTRDGRRTRIAGLVGLGDAARAMRDFAGARLRYLEALGLDTRSPELHARLAALALAVGDIHTALAAYDHALALGAATDVLIDAITAAHVGGDRERAVRWANDLLAAAPDAPIAIAARADDLRARGLAAAARAMVAGAPRHLELLLVESRAAADLGELDAATAAARAALELAPGEPRARAALADALARTLAIPDGDDVARLADALARALATRAELAPLVAAVSRAAAELEQPLLVTVMGEFSSGKSSFVNAFIGAEVAATGITPTTATINVVKYGHQRGGRIVGHDGAVRELAWDDLHAALRGLAADDARAIDRVEIALPLDELAKVHIIDTPGLNSILPEHEATARAFIARADAVVWVFTAGQGGKASERKALDSIRAEGKRVLGVLNKRDQLSDADVAEVTAYVAGQLEERVETIVPFSARAALAWKRAGRSGADDGGWIALAAALETRFFAQARQIKRAAVARRLLATIATARTTVEATRAAAEGAAAETRAARDRVLEARGGWDDAVVGRERRTLAAAVSELYSRAALEVIDLVRPRQLPFGSHSATAADRDYLIALLAAGYEVTLRAAADRIAADVRAALGTTFADTPVQVDRAIRVATEPLEFARAYVAGYLAGGAVDAFFRSDLPRLALEPDTVRHALFRAAPDLEVLVAAPLARAGQRALGDAADAIERAAQRHDVAAYASAVGLERAFDTLAGRLA